MNRLNKTVTLILLVFIFNACATYNAQYSNETKTKASTSDIAHSFYLIGDAGNSPLNEKTKALQDFEKALKNASENSTALFLGDNIYPNGLPKKGTKERAFAEHQLKMQTDAVKDFKGQTIFIPGNHDWNNGLSGLKRQEEYIEDKLGKDTFLPENGCPLEKVKISDEIVVIVVDSHWYLTDWNKHPNINNTCEIKTKIKFLDELEGLIKKSRGKTTIIAMHHPMYSNGPHDGQYDFKSHLKPLPVLGTLKNFIRKTGGVSHADLQNKHYNDFKKHVVTLAQENDKVIFVSGHEHSLQYLVQDNLPQIISGSGSKVTATRNVGGGKFSYGANGYARLDVYTDGSSSVQFYSSKDDKVVYQTQVLTPNEVKVAGNYGSPSEKSKKASIYTEKEIEKSGFHRKFWGERYRRYYGTKVNAPLVDLDTLFGGLKPIRKGGGHQSKSLRLEDKEGREYVMRALRKNALQFLQATAFKDQYIEGQFDDTYTEGLLLDVFTGSHPYAPFTVGTLSDAVGIFHTNPKLYYIPKQKALAHFNSEFGDELYMIEERAASGHGDKASFGYSNKVISTDDLLFNLNKNEKHSLDEAAYIRARLFDMLIGDWDRHEDQWRWAKFKEGDKTIYRPIPRDRDQVFSIMGDGAFMGFATKAIPSLRLMKAYSEDLKKPKWFNFEPFPLDMALIRESDKAIWDEQVKHITSNLTDAVIDDAFTHFPEEVQDATLDDIKRKLKGRRKNLQAISDRYYHDINKFGVIKGTGKDDAFVIERLANGETKVTGYRIKKGEKGPVFHERTYKEGETKEIWIYSLADKDSFEVKGDHKSKITIRLIGGRQNDTYIIENGSKVVIYDYKSKKNKFATNKGRKKLTDNYEINVYNYKKLKNTANQLIPSIGFNPDDGVKIGAINTLTTYGFERNPYTAQHTFAAAYYFATQGFDLNYRGEFANVVGNWNLGIDARFTSPNYAINFFGFGNKTPNPEADENDGLDVDLNYNRVKIRTLRFSPSLIWKGHLDSEFRISATYETYDVENTDNRFISTLFDAGLINNEESFIGAEANYHFRNKDNEAFPTLGLHTDLTVGYKSNTDNNNDFTYVIPALGFDYKLVSSGKLVLASELKGHLIFGDDFEFYQAANIGANQGLRAYRNERFIGKNSFYQTTDLRLNLKRVKTSLVPLHIGIFGGYDYGRVWLEDDTSNDWHHSVGGGFFANAADFITANISAFNGDDGIRIAFKLGFGF